MRTTALAVIIAALAAVAGAQRLNPADPLTAAVTAAGLPDSLAPGAKVTVPVVLTTAAGDAPATPAQVQVRVTSAEGSVETSTITATLKTSKAAPIFCGWPAKPTCWSNPSVPVSPPASASATRR